MSRIAPIIKREFTEAVSSRAFLIGTLLGPVLLGGLFALQFLVIARGSGGEHRVTIFDASGLGIGERVAQQIDERDAGPAFIRRPTYQLEVEVLTEADRGEAGRDAAARVVAKELDGFLWIPPDVLEDGRAEYEGSNAMNTQVTGELRAAVQRVVQLERLRARGIDEARVADALRPVRIDITRTGDRGQAGSPGAARILSFFMAFAIYIVVIMYGQSIMSSVQEEKRDRIVELIVSSVRAGDLLFGKVVGIGGAGVVQMVVWVVFAALLLTNGGVLASAFGAGSATIEALSQRAILPNVPAMAGLAFVLYFAGGFFLFATLFAVAGSIVTNAQEAQQFVFPILMPFVLGLFIAMPAAENPNGGIAVIGSIIPFTSPMVMPVRTAVTTVELWQLALSVLLLFGTAYGIIWIAAKIYRVAIFATGQKPTAREVWAWLRAA